MNRTFSLSMVCISLLLSGCDTEQNLQDIKQFIEEAKDTSKKSVDEPVPEIELAEATRYQADDKTNPFKNAIQLDMLDPSERTNTPLTQVDLETLAVVGTVRTGDDTWAFIETPSGNVYRVAKGTPVGLHHGQVSEIVGNQVEVTERVFNKLGDIFQRTVYIPTKVQ